MTHRTKPQIDRSSGREDTARRLVELAVSGLPPMFDLQAAVFDIHARGHHDRHLAQRHVGFDGSQNFNRVDVSQMHVHQNQFGLLAPSDGQNLVGPRANDAIVPFNLKQGSQQGRGGTIVVNNENLVQGNLRS